MNPTDHSIPHAASSPRPRRRLASALVAAAIAAGGLLVATAAPVAAAPAAPAAKACTSGTYTVVKGDGWLAIAKKLGVTTKSLLAANSASATTTIHPGQSLCAPAGATGATAPTTTTGTTTSSSTSSTACASSYTIAKGDSWSVIAKRVGITMKALLAANGATATTVIHPGRTLCLPAGATPSSNSSSSPAAASIKAFTAAENEATIRAIWPDDLEDEAVRIAKRESNLQNKAKNSCCYGLFQINYNAHKSWLAGIGVTSATQLLDPTVNATAAYTLYQRSGSFRPWA
ncbi:MAG: LysM peptidoglycan-binding domain-containing protein [Acidimicrobiales bacterium]